MIIPKRTAVFGLFCLSLLFLFVSGCAAARNAEPQSAASKPAHAAKAAPVIPEAELNSIVKTGKIDIGSVGLSGQIFNPKSSAAEKSVLKKIAAWLKQAKPYTGEIPSSDKYAIPKANIDPPLLHISADNHKLTIQPAFYIRAKKKGSLTTVGTCYVQGVSRLKNDRQTFYIRSSSLFSWILKGKWQSDFKGA